MKEQRSETAQRERMRVRLFEIRKKMAKKFLKGRVNARTCARENQMV